MTQDLELIRTQHPNMKPINYYLNRTVAEIEKEKKANHTDQSND